MSNIKTIATGIITGAIIGYSSAKIKQPSYTLTEKDNVTSIYSIKLREEQRIYETSNSFYIGNADHNTQGIIDISKEIGLRINENLLTKKEETNKKLEEQIKEQNQKIRNRKFFDRIEKTKDNIKYWYQDLKRRQLE